MICAESERATKAGFRFGVSGPHISRTMMMQELARCLDSLPVDADRDAYTAAIVDVNILGKQTVASRNESLRRLRELYALDPQVPIFRFLRALDARDPKSRPLLALLIVLARDPLLRATAPVILAARDDSPVTANDLDQALERSFGGHIKHGRRPTTTAARNIASTWTQSGHLVGHTNKRRQRVAATPAALTLALLLAHLCDFHGEALLTSPWCQILDLNASQARSLAAQAHREEFLNLHIVGSVVEITFPRFDPILEAMA